MFGHKAFEYLSKVGSPQICINEYFLSKASKTIEVPPKTKVIDLFTFEEKIFLFFKITNDKRLINFKCDLDFYICG